MKPSGRETAAVVPSIMDARQTKAQMNQMYAGMLATPRAPARASEPGRARSKANAQIRATIVPTT